MPAGRAFMVALIALALGALLNAQGLRKGAELEEPGTQRDVGTALAGAIADVSGVVGLDEPRETAREWLGRGNQDRINRKVELPPARRPRRAKRARPTVYTPQRKLQIYVAGDSNVIDPGPALLEEAVKTGSADAAGEVDARPATGLVRPEVFNWFAHLPGQIERRNPDLTVVSFGGNDGQGFPGVAGAGTFGSDGWTREYRRRVGGVMDLLTADGRRVLWLGLPIPRDADLASRYRRLNAIYRAEAEARPELVRFLDLYKVFSKRGKYADYLAIDGGSEQLVRQGDGIHLSSAGAEIAADKALEAIRRQVTLR